MWMLIGLLLMAGVLLGLRVADVFPDSGTSAARVERMAKQAERVLVMPEQTRRVLAAEMQRALDDCQRFRCNAAQQEKTSAAVARMTRALAVETATATAR